MQVYLAVRIYLYEENNILGVFSTQEKAQASCDNDEYGDDHGIIILTVDEDKEPEASQFV